MHSNIIKPAAAACDVDGKSSSGERPYCDVHNASPTVRAAHIINLRRFSPHSHDLFSLSRTRNAPATCISQYIHIHIRTRTYTRRPLGNVATTTTTTAAEVLLSRVQQSCIVLVNEHRLKDSRQYGSSGPARARTHTYTALTKIRRRRRRRRCRRRRRQVYSSVQCGREGGAKKA